MPTHYTKDVCLALSRTWQTQGIQRQKGSQGRASQTQCAPGSLELWVDAVLVQLVRGAAEAPHAHWAPGAADTLATATLGVCKAPGHGGDGFPIRDQKGLG